MRDFSPGQDLVVLICTVFVIYGLSVLYEYVSYHRRRRDCISEIQFFIQRCESRCGYENAYHEFLSLSAASDAYAITAIDTRCSKGHLAALGFRAFRRYVASTRLQHRFLKKDYNRLDQKVRESAVAMHQMDSSDVALVSAYKSSLTQIHGLMYTYRMFQSTLAQQSA
jgi:hypothetical protein